MVGAGRIQFTVNTRKKLLMWGAWRSFRYFPYVYKPTWLRGYKGAGWVETGGFGSRSRRPSVSQVYSPE